MPLLRKLHIDVNLPLALVNASAECMDLFTAANPVVYDFSKPPRQLVLFAVDSTELDHYIHRLEGCVMPETLFWICYPLKSGSIKSDLHLNKPWEAVFSLGYRGSASAAINSDWTALRVTNAPRKKPSICDLPMEERQSEGIDYVNRTAELPPDALQAVSQYKGLPEVFNQLSFTDKKEYVLGITDAKKPETRQRRISKMTDDLLRKMEVKANQ